MQIHSIKIQLEQQNIVLILIQFQFDLIKIPIKLFQKQGPTLDEHEIRLWIWSDPHVHIF